MAEFNIPMSWDNLVVKWTGNQEPILLVYKDRGLGMRDVEFFWTAMTKRLGRLITSEYSTGSRWMMGIYVNGKDLK